MPRRKKAAAISTPIVLPVLPVQAIVAGEVAAVRVVPSFTPSYNEAPESVREQRQDFFLLCWNLLSSKGELVELGAICDIFFELEDRRISGKTRKEQDAAWQKMVDEAKELLVFSGGSTYKNLQIILAKLPGEEWNDFFDQMEENLDRRGRFISAILRDEINSPQFTKRLLLAEFINLMRDPTIGSALELVCNLIVEQTQLDYEVESRAWRDAETALFDTLSTDDKYSPAYQALINKLAGYTHEKRENFYKLVGNILGGSDQAFVLMETLARRVEAHLKPTAPPVSPTNFVGTLSLQGAGGIKDSAVAIAPVEATV